MALISIQQSTSPSSFGMKTGNIPPFHPIAEPTMNYFLRGGTTGFNERNKWSMNGYIPGMEYSVNRTIKISRGDVVAIGNVKTPRAYELERGIPLLSFLDIQESATSFISTCIPLRIDGYGKTIEEAEEDMIDNISYFLYQNFEKLSPEDAQENIKDLEQLDEWSNELWDAYNKAKTWLPIKEKQWVI